MALSALVIAYAVNTDRIAADYANMQRTKLAVETSAAGDKAEWNQRKAQLDGTNDDLNRQLAAAKASRIQLDGDVVNLRADLAKEKASRAAIESKLAELGETAKTLTAIVQNYREENNTLRGNELSYRTRQAELDDRINDLVSQNDVLNQNYRALQEQIAEAKRAQEQMLSGNKGGTDQPYVFTGSPINGRIEAVQMDPASKKMIAKISVGTNDRVAKNMKFFVVRGNSFLGNLVITEPDLKWSLGVVDTLGQPVEVKEGDIVMSRLQ